MPSLTSHDPAKIIIVLGGFQLQGLSSGEFVKVSRSVESVKKDVGADGRVVRVFSRDKSGEVVVTVQAESEANDYLSNLALEDEAAGTGVRSLMIKNLNGTSIYTAAEAWVTKHADGTYGDEASKREWTIHCADLEMFNGGNVI